MTSKGFLKKTALLVCGVLIVTALGAFGLKRAAADSVTFSGTVQLPNGSGFTEGGSVNIYNASNSYSSSIYTDGGFSITGIQAGTYTLDVSVSQSSSYANPAQQQITLTSSLSGFAVRVATPTIRGMLALPDGTPTRGCVNVHNSTWTINGGYCTEDDGAFKIGALDAGTYILSVSTPDNSPYVGAEQSVTITDSSSTLELGTVKFENPFVVGKVAFPDGTLIPWSDDWNQRIHLSVDLWNNDNTVNRHSNYDSDSKFKFGRMPAGTYTIHINVWDTELYTGSANQTITVSENGLDMTATPVRLSTPQLSGVVYKPDGTTPVQNAWVNLHSEDWSVNQGSSTDTNGTYRIGGLDAGTYNLEVNPPHDQTDMVRYEESGVTITSSLTTKNITLTAARKFVKGTVKKPDGRGIACASVNANRRGGQGWAGATTDSDGSYTLILSPGSWNVRVEPSNNWDCPAADWIFTDSEAMVDFPDSSTEQTETVNFTVQKATAKIVGTVKTRSGTKITNGNINANSQTTDGRNRWSNAQIKADGTYTLNLMPGTYDLNVWTQDNRLFTRNQKVTVSKDETKIVNFTMGEKLAHIKGTVTDKSGRPLAGIYLNGNLDCGPEECSAWSNTQTASDGTYDMAATAGRWNLNFDSGRGAAYVYDGPMNEVYVETETSTVSGINFALTYADVTLKGKIVDETGKVFSDFQGWAFVRPTTVTEGNGYREYGGGVNQGVFNFRVPSSLFTIAEIGVHMPPNSRYSSVPGATVTLVADATIEKDIVVKENDAAIAGRFIDSSGLPLGKCDFRGEVFANAQDNQWHGTQINPDCTYEISLLAGTYNVGYHVDTSSGILNRPTNTQVTVASGSRAQQDLKVLTGDARVNVFVVNPDGTPARRAWVWAGNHQEIDEERRSAEKQSNEGDFVGPGGTKSAEELFAFCSEPENEKECADFKLPPGAEGPGGCTTALECTQYCQKNKKQCDEAVKKDGTVMTTSTVPVSLSAKTRKARVAGFQSVEANAVQDDDDPFANVIETGGETNDEGVATLSLISGHRYMVNAGVAPETGYMPPREVEVNLVDKKTANMTLVLRQADGKMTGFVLWNNVAVRNGWVGCWSEDGSNTGSPIINGTYSMNYTFKSIYHCNANAFDGTTFLNSDEKIVVIEIKKKTTTNFAVGAANYQLPPAISESFDATSAHVMTLADGTTFNIPANSLASSGTVTVNVSPTVNVQSQKTAQPIAYAYNAQAFDSDNKEITTFNDDVTMCFKYSDEMLADAGIEENALISSYWDTSSGSWKQPENTTQNKDNNTICVSANHFTPYAVVNKSGKGKGQNLTSVTKEKTKKGKTKIVIGSGKSKKSVIPFPSYTGDVSVTTFRASKKAGQVIVAAPTKPTKNATTYKIYSVKGKLTQTTKPFGAGYSTGVRLDSDDLTKNGYADLVVAPSNGGQVRVVDMKKTKTYTVKAPRVGTIVADTLNLKGRGTNQLAITAGRTIETWDFVNGSFKKFDFDQRRLRATATTIERVTLQPVIHTTTPKNITVKKSGTVKITLTGENFGKDSRVYLNQTIPAKKVEVTGDTKLVATFNLALLRKNKNYDITVVNGDGEQISIAGLKTKK